MIEAKMQNILPELGKTLRLFREKSGRNLETVSREAGISISMLSQIERGVVSASIDTLFMVCRALDIDMAALFGRLSPSPSVRIHKRGERLKMEGEGVRYEQLMTASRGRVSVELFLIEVDPGCATEMNGGGHEGTEMGYVLCGCATLSVGSERFAVAEGDSICFAADETHRLENPGKKKFKAVWSISPPHVDYLKNSNKATK